MNTAWKEEDNKLSKTFVFEDFTTAFAWMVKASHVIEQLDHHPDWRNCYNRVEVILCTHDAGNTITQKDRDLAELLDSL